MSNIWISAAQAAHVPGVQKKSMTEVNQIQATFASPTFDYQPHLVATNPGAEPNQIQATFSITSFNYA